MLSEVDFKSGVFTTISEVRTRHDLSSSTILVQVLPYNESQYALATLEHERATIQSKLHKRLHLKVVPKIVFEHDVRPEDVAHLDTLLSTES